MPAPRKPTRLHHLSGSAKRHPERMRNRTHEPQITACLRDLPPPEHLDKELREIWTDVAQDLEPWVAGEPDFLAFEMLCRLIRMLRTDQLTPAFGTRLHSMLGEFGLTPKSRTKLSAPKPRKAKT